MDLNELQSVQSRERQTDSLQQLRATFYQDAADYIQDLEAERDTAAERADDPWNAPEVGRLNDDIDTAKGTVEAIYDRRVGKIVKMASLAAADMPTDDEGLTEEEQALFDRLVAAIEQNREGVFAILDGEDPPVEPTDGVPTESDSPAQGSPDPAASPSAEVDGAASSDDRSQPAASGDDHREVPQAPDRSEPGATTGGSAEPDVGAADLMGGTDGTDAGQDTTQSGDPGTDDPSADPGPTDPTVERESTDAVDAGHPGRDGADADLRSTDSSVKPLDDGVGTDGGDAPDVEPDASGANEASTRTTESRDESPDHAADSRRESGEATTDESGSSRPGEADAHTGDPEVDRTMVRITDDVGPIYGVEGREYDLTADDVVTLPEANVGPLLKQGAAERLD